MSTVKQEWKKVKIELVVMGDLPYRLDLEKIKRWKSLLFEITKTSTCKPPEHAKGEDEWEYSDAQLNEPLHDPDEVDIVLAVTSVPVEKKYTMRRFADNRACMTYSEKVEMMIANNIPLENFLLRGLYYLSLVYLRSGGKIPHSKEDKRYTHDETKGCIFDMCGIRPEVLYSLHKPRICRECLEKIQQELHGFPANRIQLELNEIKKDLIYQVTDFVKRYPVLSLFLSSCYAVFLGVVASMIASFIL